MEKFAHNFIMSKNVESATLFFLKATKKILRWMWGNYPTGETETTQLSEVRMFSMHFSKFFNKDETLDAFRRWDV